MKVELLNHSGSDLMIVNVARVSYGKESEELNEKDEKLLKYLVKHKHTSPFRHPTVQYRITCPVYVERQLFKHQVGVSVNSISGRYVDFSDSYSSIDIWRRQSKSSKQGSEGVIHYQESAREIEQDIINRCKAAYNQLLDIGVSKEQARTILPLNLNTTFIWTGSLLALFHLFNLRLKEDTQLETRNVANDMLKQLKEIDKNPFKNSINAFKPLIMELDKLLTLDDKRFHIEKKKMSKWDYSAFYQFNKDLRYYRITRKHNEVFPYQLWHSGFKNIDQVRASKIYTLRYER